MAGRFWTYRRSATLIVLVAAACTLFWYWRTAAILRQELEFIDTRYEKELSSIRLAMRTLRSDGDVRNGTDWVQARDAAARELSVVFASDDFLNVSWSFDGHHGLRGIKQTIAAFRWDSPVNVKRGDTSLRNGKANDGRDFLVYQAWVVDAPAMRHFQIVFDADTIQSKVLAH